MKAGLILLASVLLIMTSSNCHALLARNYGLGSPEFLPTVSIEPGGLLIEGSVWYNTGDNTTAREGYYEINLGSLAQMFNPITKAVNRTEPSIHVAKGGVRFWPRAAKHPDFNYADWGSIDGTLYFEPSEYPNIYRIYFAGHYSMSGSHMLYPQTYRVGSLGIRLYLNKQFVVQPASYSVNHVEFDGLEFSTLSAGWSAETEHNQSQLALRTASLEGWKKSANITLRNISSQFTGIRNNVSKLSTQISVLQAGRQALNSTIMAVQTQLDTVKQWLLFWKYDTIGKSLCDVVANECKTPTIKCESNGDCGTDGYKGNPSCSGNNVFQSYVAYKCNNAGLSTAYCSNTTASQLKTACAKKCLSGTCVDCLTGSDCASGQNCVNYVCQGGTPPPTGRCSFRTNAVGGIYASGTWIAVDVDNDGDLEGFAYSGSSGGLAACGGTNVAKTAQGYNVAIVSGKPQVCVPITGGKVVQKKYLTASSAAVTSTSPTQPYTGNGQEVCQQ